MLPSIVTIMIMVPIEFIIFAYKVANVTVAVLEVASDDVDEISRHILLTG